MPNLERVNIADQARELREYGYVDGFAESHFDPSLGPKPELYALAAVLIDDIVAHAYRERDVRGMTEAVYPAGPFEVIKEQLHQELLEMAHGAIIRFQTGKGSEVMNRNFKRFDSVRRAYDPSASNLKFLNAGIGTATNVMANVLIMIPRLLQEGSRTHERMSRAADSTYPLIVRLAVMHKVPLVELKRKLAASSGTSAFRAFDVNNFQLREVAGKERLVFSAQGEDLVDQIAHEEELFSDIQRDGPRVGCPAIVNFGEGSAIRTLWDWHLEIAGKVYPMFYPSENQVGEAAA